MNVVSNINNQLMKTEVSGIYATGETIHKDELNAVGHNQLLEQWVVPLSKENMDRAMSLYELLERDDK